MEDKKGFTEAQLAQHQRLRELYPKGKPVANNNALHHTARIHTHPQDPDRYYVTVIPQPQWKPVRGDYTPTGNSFVYPKKWGDKEAVLHMIAHRLDDIGKSIHLLQEEERKLSVLMSEVQEWKK
jgi:hypothetical protein